MQVKTRIKAGGLNFNHNETLVRTPKPAPGLKVKTHVKAGGLSFNHNETLVRAKPQPQGLKVKTRIKADRGLARTPLQCLATAAALNIVRLGEWFAGTPRAKTRCPPFAALKAA